MAIDRVAKAGQKARQALAGAYSDDCGRVNAFDKPLTTS
jgi:hypothetical protein